MSKLGGVRLRARVVVVLVVVGMFCLTGAASALAFGTITGTVTNASTGAPVTNTGVEAVGSNTTSTACTAADGTYTLPGLSAGSYKVDFVNGGCGGSYFDQWYNDKPSAAAADPVTVTDGATTTLSNAALQPAGQISGKITDAATGQGLNGEGVIVYRTNGDVIGFTCSRSDGTYTYPGLTTGTYKVGVNTSFTFCFGGSAVHYLPRFYRAAASIDDADLISVTQGSITGADVALTVEAKITGTVTAAAGGAPLSDVQVLAYDSSGNQAGFYCTNANGTYTISTLPTGSYRLEFSSNQNCGTNVNYVTRYYSGKSSLATADPVSATEGQTTSNINTALQTEGQIAGTVTAATGGAPVHNEGVTVYDSGGNAVTTTCTAADGSYTTAGLPDGSYTVAFTSGLAGDSSCPAGNNYLPQYYDGKASRGAADPVTVAAGSTHANVNAALATGGQITGTVTAATGGADVQNAAVSVYDAGGNVVGTACTAADGTYTVSQLPTGSYRVGFANGCGASNNYLPQFSSGKSTLASADPVSVTAGSPTSGIDAALLTGGRIFGIVTAAFNGSGRPGFAVSVYDANGTVVGTACTFGDGSYGVRGLPTGSYKVGFANGCNNATSGFETQYYSGHDTLASADPVSVTAGSDVGGIDASMQLEGDVAGTVTGTSGNPILGIGVTVYDPNNNNTVVGVACTQSNGTYDISNVPHGTYKVGFTPNAVSNISCGLGNANYLPQYYQGKASLADADPVTVSNAQTTTVNDQLATAGQITGTVTAASDGRGLGDITVSVYDTAGNVVKTACTNADGSYSVIDLASGSYRVGFDSSYSQACPGDGLFQPQFANGKSTLAAADPVSVTAGSTASGIDGSLADAKHELTVTTTGSGSVASAPVGLSCSATCSHAFANGASVTLTATPTAGHRFTGWSGSGCSGTGSCTVSTDSDKSVTATFVATPTLTVTKAGTGAGSVSSTPSGITCGGTCASAFDSGTSVTLTATPAPGSTFAGWSGGGCSGTGPCPVVLGSDQTVTATFTAVTHSLTVTKAGTGSGSVSSSPAGITCPGTCSHSYTVTTSVTLTAAAASGSTFTGWSGGGCSGTGPCAVAMSADKAVTATFSAVPPPPPGTTSYELHVSTDGSGSVSSSPSGIACPSSCGHAFTAGSSVRLTAHPASGWKLVKWSGGGCSGTGTCTVTLNADQAVRATFTRIPPRPSCSVKLKSGRVLLRAPRGNRAARARVGRLYVEVKCSQAATVRLAATVTEVLTRHHKRIHHAVSLGTKTGSVKAGRTTEFTFVLPAGALQALRGGVPESVGLVLRATNANGSVRVTGGGSRLRGG